MKKKYEWSKLFDIFFIINASSDIVWPGYPPGYLPGYPPGYPPGYLMLPNLTNQYIKLSGCRPMVRMKFGHFSKLLYDVRS